MQGTLRYGDTLADAVLPVGDDRTRAVVRDIGLIVAAVVLISVAAQVSIPWYPVPFTGQTFAVLLAGGVLGMWRATAAMSIYFLVGIAGAPVFSDQASGWSVITGPTGGYIIGFILAAALIGFLAEKGADRNIVSMIGALILGEAIIFGLGAWWLAEQDLPNAAGELVRFGWSAAYDTGVEPFILGDLLKLAIVAAILPLGWAGVRALGLKRGPDKKREASEDSTG